MSDPKETKIDRPRIESNLSGILIDVPAEDGKVRKKIIGATAEITIGELKKLISGVKDKNLNKHEVTVRFHRQKMDVANNVANIKCTMATREIKEINP